MSKACFSKSGRGPFGILKQVLLAHFEPYFPNPMTALGTIPPTVPTAHYREEPSQCNPTLFGRGAVQTVGEHLHRVHSSLEVLTGEGCRLADTYICIYHYTPLPLNLASNKQQATTSYNKQQAVRLHAVLAIAPSLCFGCFSNVAILESRMALPNPSFEPETHWWRPGAVAPSRQVPSQICAVLGQKQPFFAQNSPQNPGETPHRREQWIHPTCGLTSPCQGAL